MWKSIPSRECGDLSLSAFHFSISFHFTSRCFVLRSFLSFDRDTSHTSRTTLANFPQWPCYVRCTSFFTSMASSNATSNKLRCHNQSTLDNKSQQVGPALMMLLSDPLYRKVGGGEEHFIFHCLLFGGALIVHVIQNGCESERGNAFLKMHFSFQSTNTTQASLSTQMSNTVCQHFLRGTCKFGDRCRYLHPQNQGGPKFGATSFGGGGGFGGNNNSFSGKFQCFKGPCPMFDVVS